MDNKSILIKEFNEEMIEIYNKALREVGYKATKLLNMVTTEGGYETAKKLVRFPGGTHGFEVLWEKKRLDLSVEALVISDKYSKLFSDEIITICNNRLKDYGYVLKDNIADTNESVTRINNLDINEIRIIPMSNVVEFQNKSIEEVQEQFFMNELLKKEKGVYYLRSNAPKSPVNTILLFQYRGNIIASAILEKIIKNNPLVEGLYEYSLILNKESIKVFTPLNNEEIKGVFKAFKSFSQAKQILDISKLDELLNLIENKGYTCFPDEIFEEEKLIEGAKKTILVNSYERSQHARNRCIEYHGSICKICNFDFGKIYGDKMKGKIHVHHIKPLNEIGEEYEVDFIKDLIPICPNCHLVIHSKQPAYTVDEVRNLLNN